MDIAAVLNNPKKNLVEVYFDLQKHYESIYGPETIIFIELGSFFEIYGVENENMHCGQARQIADILNIQLTRRNKNIKENTIENPLMAGFPTQTFDRYINRLIQEKKYTIVIIRQKGTPPNISRYVDQILSPGVHMEYSLDHADNYVASILVEEHKGLYSVGYAALDIMTGKTYLFEGHSTLEDKTAALDQLFALMQAHTIAELVCIPGAPTIDTQKVLQYLEFSERKTVHIRQNRLSIQFQNDLFKHAYVIKSFLSPIEFLDLEKKPCASESLAHLIAFVVEHDSTLIEHLKKPDQIDTQKFLYLGNSPLEQLNIISKDPHEQTVLTLFDFTTTSIGKRLFKDRITHPITDPREIQSRYDLCTALSIYQTEIHDALKEMYDLERLIRRIKIGRLHPSELNYLYNSLVATQAILLHFNTEVPHESLTKIHEDKQLLEQCINYIEKTFNLDETAKVNRQTISESLFELGYHKELDAQIQKRDELYCKLSIIQEKFESLIHENRDNADTSFVQIKRGDKEGHYLSVTKGRFSLIKEHIPQTFISIDQTVYALSDFHYRNLTTSVKITADIITDISKEIIHIENSITQKVRELFAKEIDNLHETYIDLFEIIAQTIAKIDVAIATLISKKQLRLVEPQIVDATESLYISIQDLRHPLVEATEQNGIYVPNSLVLGDKTYFSEQDQSSVLYAQTQDDVRGILLYGINSSGKSSLMKSVGIAIMLAQSGMYVPASQMQFSMCTELFTRIVSKDNFEKGLSSFAVEMMELKNIFNRATQKSLILGDEISHGTETLSAIAIVSATIQRLVEKNASFIFTTHLHQIYTLELIKKLNTVASVHMSVHYDKKLDTLVFDRTLQAGNGSAIYGLEFAQSLHMDQTFLSYAQNIRKSLANTHSEIELLTKGETSKYNKNVYLSRCAICKDTVQDTHHISEQQHADTDGNIGHFHKNHQYNLLPICKLCHDKIHHKKIHVTGFVMTTQGLELMYDIHDDTAKGIDIDN